LAIADVSELKKTSSSKLSLDNFDDKGKSLTQLQGSKIKNSKESLRDIKGGINQTEVELQGQKSNTSLGSQKSSLPQLQKTYLDRIEPSGGYASPEQTENVLPSRPLPAASQDEAYSVYSSKSSIKSFLSKSKTLSESQKNFLKSSKSSLDGSDSQINVFSSKAKTLRPDFMTQVASEESFLKDKALLRVALEESSAFSSPITSPGQFYDMYNNAETEARQPAINANDNKTEYMEGHEISTVISAIDGDDILSVYSSNDSVLKDIPVILNPDKQPPLHKPSIDFNDLLGSLASPTYTTPSNSNMLATTAKAIIGLTPTPMDRKPSRILTEVLTASSQSAMLGRTPSLKKNTANGSKRDSQEEEDLNDTLFSFLQTIKQSKDGHAASDKKTESPPRSRRLSATSKVNPAAKHQNEQDGDSFVIQKSISARERRLSKMRK
jgi:hypothetical protein